MSSILQLPIANMSCPSGSVFFTVASKMHLLWESIPVEKSYKARIDRLKAQMKLMQDLLREINERRKSSLADLAECRRRQDNIVDHYIHIYVAWNVMEELLQRFYQKVSVYQHLVYLLLLFCFFSEYPNSIRHYCTTMPWTIWPSLVVLWGVCWMFYPSWGEDGMSYEDLPGHTIIEPSSPRTASYLAFARYSVLGFGGAGLNVTSFAINHDATPVPATAQDFDQALWFNTGMDLAEQEPYVEDLLGSVPDVGDFAAMEEDSRLTKVASVASMSPAALIAPTTEAIDWSSIGATQTGVIGGTESPSMASVPMSDYHLGELNNGPLLPPALTSGIATVTNSSLLHCPKTDCNRMFSSKAALTKHIARHERAFTCDTCARKFGSKIDCERHQATVHENDQTFICLEIGCKRAGKPFSRRDNLLKHIREVHGRNSPIKAASLAGSSSSETRASSAEHDGQIMQETMPSMEKPVADLFLPLTHAVDAPPATSSVPSADMTATFEIKLHELQMKMERRMDDLSKEHEAELKSQREMLEAELRNQQSRHELREDRLWELLRTSK